MPSVESTPTNTGFGFNDLLGIMNMISGGGAPGASGMGSMGGLGGMLGGMGLGGGGGMGGSAGTAGMIANILATSFVPIAQALTNNRVINELESMGDDVRDLFLNTRFGLEDIANALDFPEVDINPRDLLFALVNPQNRALSGATFDVLTQLGLPAGGVISQGGPLVEARNILGRSGLKKKQLNRAFEYLTGEREIDPDGKNPGLAPALRALAELGYTGETAFEDFQAAQQEFDERTSELERISEEGGLERFQQRQGIIDSSYQSIEDLLGGDGLLGLEQRVIQSRLSDLADMREQALAAANRGGYNPAAELENVADAENDLRNVDALERAILLLGGGIETSQRAINAVNSPIQNLMGLGGITTSGLIGAGGLATNQSNAINQLLASQEFFNASGNWAEQLQQAQMFQDALALGLQGGLAELPGDFLNSISFALNAQNSVNYLNSLAGSGDPSTMTSIFG